MTKPMTEAQFTYATNLTIQVYTDPGMRVTRLLELAGFDFSSISVRIDELKATLKVLKATQAKAAAPAPATVLTWCPPKSHVLVDGKIYKLKPNKYNPATVYVYGGTSGEWYMGKLTDAKNAHIAAAVATPELAKAATIAYAEKTTRCGVCNTKLSDPKSIAAKIGPVCAKKYA